MEFTKKTITSKFLENGLKESSSKNYAAALITIIDRLEGGNLDVLKKKTGDWFNKKRFDDSFKHLKTNTIRNYISAVVSWMKLKNETSSKLFIELSKERDEHNDVYERILREGKKTDYEENMWVDGDEIGRCFSEKILPFLERLNFTNPKKPLPSFSNFDNKELKKIKEYVILAVYLFPFYDKGDFGVIRNDIVTLLLSTGGKLEENKNYFVITRGKYFLRMSDYKTKNVHGDIKISIPPLLGIILKRWAIFSQKENGDNLFIGISKHGVTEILQRNLKVLLGKGLGVQMLRKIYVSYKFGDSIREEDAVANSMMHSVKTQHDVYNKI